MSYEEEIVKYLATLQVGEILSRKQIIEGVHNLYGRNKSSIIPSDYCYNIVNYDIKAHNFEKGHPRLLEWIERGKYRYLGKNYPYTGTITHKGIIVGSWKNGTYFVNMNYQK